MRLPDTKYLDILDKELKHFYNQFYTINLDFIDILDKCYNILNRKKYTNSYTLFEYCILLKKYKYINFVNIKYNLVIFILPINILNIVDEVI